MRRCQGQGIMRCAIGDSGGCSATAVQRRCKGPTVEGGATVVHQQKPLRIRRETDLLSHSSVPLLVTEMIIIRCPTRP